LTKTTATSVAKPLVSCRLDYCIQNSLALVVTCKLKYDHITPFFKLLHWLPNRYGCDFKVLTLVYKYLSLGLPAFFDQVLNPHVSSVNTWSSNLNKIIHTVLNLKPGQFLIDGSFMHVAPRLWNSLPIELCTALSLYTFRCKLKTHYFA
jgi:hypothetical protein